MDYASLFGGGGEAGSKATLSSATAQTIFGGYNTNLEKMLPWIIGGAAVAFLAMAAVLIAAVRK